MSHALTEQHPPIDAGAIAAAVDETPQRTEGDTLRKAKRKELIERYKRDPELCGAIIDRELKLDFKRVGLCKLSKKFGNRKNGYIQLNWNGAGKFAMLHQVLAWSRGLVAQGDDQVSHLCGNPTCLVPEHVVIKSPAKNNGRKGCGMTVPCLCRASCTCWQFVCWYPIKCVSRAVGEH
ncbi:hypothetical protein FCULG_00012036 [Fusarium culmorum]|uniref:Zinc-binding loop region of homing endonuclease domain-containing protein n=1 Tax=Fusarium culmorum TaxID=5516 RepID=A0A2T4GFH6_FUSCU|nr:hypothetical protein FCULG_00012036 [Fusarium culmorum]